MRARPLGLAAFGRHFTRSPMRSAEPVIVSEPSDWESPKSSSITRPPGVIITLLGLRSRCRMPRAWACCSASATWPTMRRHVLSHEPAKSGPGSAGSSGAAPRRSSSARRVRERTAPHRPAPGVFLEKLDVFARVLSSEEDD
jgi:hypothetical protein